MTTNAAPHPCPRLGDHSISPGTQRRRGAKGQSQNNGHRYRSHALEATKRRGGSAHRRGQASTPSSSEHSGLSLLWQQPEEAYGGDWRPRARAARRIDAASTASATRCRPLPARRREPRSTSSGRDARGARSSGNPWPLVLMSSASTSRERWRPTRRKALRSSSLASVGAVATAATAQAVPHRRAGQRGHRGSGGRRAVVLDRLGAVSRTCDVARDDVLSENRAACAGSSAAASMTGHGAPPLAVRHGPCRVPRGGGAVLLGRTPETRPVPHAPVTPSSRRAPAHEPVRAARGWPARRRRRSKWRLAVLNASLATIHAARRCYLRDGDGVDADVVGSARGLRGERRRVEESKRLPGRGRTAAWLVRLEAVRGRSGPTNAGFLTGRTVVDRRWMTTKRPEERRLSSRSSVWRTRTRSWSAAPSEDGSLRASAAGSTRRWRGRSRSANVPLRSSAICLGRRPSKRC